MNEVEAVKTRNEIAAIETLLRKHHGEIYADIWKVGLNLSLRISDLLAIRFADLDLDRREYNLIEGKTGKRRKIRLNNTALKIIVHRRKEHPQHVHLFQVESNRAKGKPISRNSVSRAFKDAGDRIGLRINTHSMRKSRGLCHVHRRRADRESQQGTEPLPSCRDDEILGDYKQGGFGFV